MDNTRGMQAPGTKGARLVTLIETESMRGAGTRDDLQRFIREYWTLDGLKVAEFDPFIMEAAPSSEQREDA